MTEQKMKKICDVCKGNGFVKVPYELAYEEQWAELKPEGYEPELCGRPWVWGVTDCWSLVRDWYKENKRDLPWRNSKDPYKIWVSEIILQQTQISQGTKYYFNFIEKFPDLKTLSKSTESDVLKTWEGLGYYSRAINMLNNAKLLVTFFADDDQLEE